MIVYKLKVLKDTIAKRQPVDSQLLLEKDKAHVKKGQEFYVLAFSKMARHYYVTLDGSTINNYNTLYFFEDHVRIEEITWRNINWTDFDSRVSKYFTVGEVTKWDWRRIPKDNVVKQNIVRLAKELDVVRYKWGGPIKVTSWYRPPAINLQEGGVRNSQHVLGSAADIRPVSGDIFEFQRRLDQDWWRNRALGLGAPSFCHCDLRPGRIRWGY